MSKYKLKRYNYDFDCYNFLVWYECNKGKWVLWEDVEPLLQAYLSLINKRNDDLSITRIGVLK